MILREKSAVKAGTRPAFTFRSKPGLATQTQTLDELQVTVGVFTLQVVQQLTTLVYHPDQAAAGMVILLVGLELILQLVDVGARQSYLNLGGTGSAFPCRKF